MNTIASSPEKFQSFKPARISRRGLLKTAVAGGAGMLGWAALVEPHWYQINRRTLQVANLPSGWNGKRMVHLSDLHVGRTSVSYIQKVIRSVNELDPDLLMITGDLVNETCRLEEGQLEYVLKELRPARIASLACLGNHDYGPGWSQSQVAERVTQIAQAHGIRVLRNEKTEIDGVDFLGLDDFMSPRFSPQETLAGIRRQRASICLCHNPDVVDVVDWNQMEGVILSGHTHGGQCKPPFLPPPLLPVRNRRYAAGLVPIHPRRSLFVSRGIGHTLPVRFNCRPEVAVFRLESI